MTTNPEEQGRVTASEKRERCRVGEMVVVPDAGWVGTVVGYHGLSFRFVRHVNTGYEHCMPMNRLWSMQYIREIRDGAHHEERE